MERDHDGNHSGEADFVRCFGSRWRSSLLPTLALLVALATPCQAEPIDTPQGPQWRVVKPSNSGIPGEEMRFARWAPDGKLWTGARWPFWGEGGLGIYDTELDVFEVHSNWETPIPSEFVNDLEFDANGVAWIATGAGLVRYDGETWTVWNAANSPMALDAVANLAIAPNGHVWVNNSSFSAPGDAVYDFDGVSTWVRHAVPNELPWNAPWTDLAQVFVARNGRVYVTNDTQGGIAEWDGQRWVVHGEPLGRLGHMAEDGAGNLWVMGNASGGDQAYFRWDGTAFQRFAMPSPNTLNGAPDGRVYVGNWHGEVRRISADGQTTETFLTGLNQVYDIAVAPDGDVWVTTLGAVGHFRDDGAWVRDYNTWNTGMPDYFIGRLTSDRDGYLWIASGESGLSRFDGSRWRNWGNHNAGAEPYPFAGNEPMGTAYLDRQGVHWFGGNGIARWHSATGEFSGFWNWQNNPGMGVSLWTYFAEDAAGTLFSVDEWGATFRFDRTTQQWRREAVQPYAPLGLPGMHADGAGRVWLAGWFDVHLWNGTEWSILPLPYGDYFFDLGGSNAFAIGPDDSLWFGTNEGLVRYDGSSFKRWHTGNSPLPWPQVTALDIRNDGLVGLTNYDFNLLSGAAATIEGSPDVAANWAVYQQSETPIPHWQVEAAHFDANGDLWVGATSEGAAVLQFSGARRPALAPPNIGAAACETREWLVTDGVPGTRAFLLFGLQRATRELPVCPRSPLGLQPRRMVGAATVDDAGVARIPATLPCAAAGHDVLLQVIVPANCTVSAVLPVHLPER